MNMRRLKKKKGNSLYTTQQQIAQDKLFQISYFYQEKDVDQSNILTVDYKPQETYSRVLTKAKQTISPIRHRKRSSMGKQIKTKVEQVIEQQISCQQLKISQKTQNVIFNTLRSTHVFVGNNIKGIQRKDNNQQLLQTKRRLQTMPLIPRLEPISNRPYLKTENSLQNSSQRFYINQKQRILGGILGHRQAHSICNNKKLKQKLRLDLFKRTFTSTLRQK